MTGARMRRLVLVTATLAAIVAAGVVGCNDENARRSPAEGAAYWRCVRRCELRQALKPDDGPLTCHERCVL